VISGRMFRPGSAEIVVGRSIGERFDGTGIGERLRFGGRDWTVVGAFDAGRGGECIPPPVGNPGAPEVDYHPAAA